MISSKHFDIFSPLTGGCSEGLDAFRVFFKKKKLELGTCERAGTVEQRFRVFVRILDFATVY